MEIDDLKERQRNVNLEGVKVTELSPVKEFSRMGEPGRVCNATIEDDSGSVALTLWNDEIDEVEEGDILNIKNGYVKMWRGNMQVNTGRKGSFEVVDD
jgi:replication factor A1